MSQLNIVTIHGRYPIVLLYELQLLQLLTVTGTPCILFFCLDSDQNQNH